MSGEKRIVNEEEILAAVDRLNERVELERVLSMRMYTCMASIEKILTEIAACPGADLFHCVRDGSEITMSAKDRVVTFAAAAGAASDARLSRPRGINCAQVLIFGHLSGQDEGILLKTFRVYPDGLCSDGEDTWKVEADSAKFVQLLTHIIIHNLIDCDFLWPCERSYQLIFRQYQFDTIRWNPRI